MDKFKFNMPSEARRLIYSYKNTKMKLLKTVANLQFNKECKHLGITPKCIKINICNSNSTSGQKTKQKAVKYWLESEIKLLHKKKDLLNRKLMNIHLELANYFNNYILLTILDEITTPVVNEYMKITQNQCHKINKLKSEQLHSQNKSNKNIGTHKFYDRVVNQTDIIFTEREHNLLNKGLKYNVQPDLNPKIIKDFIVATKYAVDIAKLSHNEKTVIAQKAMKAINNELNNQEANYKAHQDDRKTLKNINKKLRDHEAIITKADKGNSLCIMKEEEYIRKTLEFFTDNDITEIQKDPTKTFQTKLKSQLKNTHFLLTDCEKKYCTIMNPRAPKLRSQPKIHKKNCPIRPIVNSRNSPGYKITNKLNQILAKMYTYTENYSIKNSQQLIEEIKNINIPHSAQLASFDITNLYTNIPIPETLNVIRSNLIKHKKLALPEIYEFMDLLELVLKYNYFTFNNKIYMQHRGLAMGSSIAGTIANIYINHLEKKTLGIKSSPMDKIIYYKRYVDDTLLLVDGDTNDINKILDTLNKQDRNIKFTVEYENNGSINFLDLNISKENNLHTFKVHRKTTTTDTTIHSSSCHPTTYKHAAYRALVNRASRIPMKKHAELDELNTIKQIAAANGYDVTLIDNLTQKKKNIKDPTVAQKKKPTACIPFTGKLSYKIANIFRPHNINIAFTTHNKLQHTLRHNINTRTDKHTQSGIYKIVCSSCKALYVGQTGRDFHTRYNEHINAYRTNNYSKSAIATHIKDTSHPFHDIASDLHILHKMDKGHEMDLYEELEIFIHGTTHGHKLLNDKLESNNINFYKNFSNIDRLFQ